MVSDFELRFEARMSIKLEKETHKYLIGSIKRFFAEHMDDEIGDLKAALVLDFCTKEIGPSIYNQAVADAQAYFQEKTSDLSGARYEAEFDFWKQ
jgi:uncharacterized protein (DUF2164 family)